MKKFALITAIGLMLALTGCDDGTRTKTRESDGICPHITVYAADTDPGLFFYAVDERTGVVYIMGLGYYRGYMTVALNADGSPITRDQIEELAQGERW